MSLFIRSSKKPGSQLLEKKPLASATGRAVGSALFISSIGASGVLGAQSFVTELSTLNGSDGFVLNGINIGDRSGTDVTTAGDVNGDGLTDLIIGSRPGTPSTDTTGASYVVFGSTSPFGSAFELSNLNGTNGFTINGSENFERAGLAVDSAGDLNADGIDDLILGTDASGDAYIIFGSTNGFESVIELSALDGSNGFLVNGYDNSSTSVSHAGDINDDGIDDAIIGARNFNSRGISSGGAYVVFGSAAPFSAELSFTDLDGNNGFIINGADMFDATGAKVSTAGDINNDGIDDLMINAPNSDINGSNTGAVYILFGSTQIGAEIQLSNLNGANGFVIAGIDPANNFGYSISELGDINADGIADIIVGDLLADPNGGASGASYVIFGRNTPFPAVMELSELNGNTGFVINGNESGDASGISVSAAGDINNDGVDDITIGALRADPNGSASGASYVIFGRNMASTPFSASFELSDLDNNSGLVFNGINADDYSGTSVGMAGDINGDGIDDLIIGASFADPNGDESGESYVIFGGSTLNVEASPVPTLNTWSMGLLASLMVLLGSILWRRNLR